MRGSSVFGDVAAKPSRKKQPRALARTDQRMSYVTVQRQKTNELEEKRVFYSTDVVIVLCKATRSEQRRLMADRLHGRYTVGAYEYSDYGAY